MKIEIKGRLKSVSAPESKSEKFTVQEIILSRQSTDEFGDMSGQENIYPFQVVNSDIEKLNLKALVGKKVKATGYINGREYEEKFYVSLRLRSIEVLEASANGFPEAVESPVVSYEKPFEEPVPVDDLPF